MTTRLRRPTALAPSPQPQASRPRVSVIVPTFNERENIRQLLEDLRLALRDKWTYEVVVVDDNSPDGTGRLVRQLSRLDPAVRLVSRPRKLGLGSAVADGFRVARGGYLVMMDGDLSHRPEDLPAMLDRLAECDIVVGSRYISGGTTVGWPMRRRLMSRLGSALGKWVSGTRVRDTTSGFAAFRSECIGPVLPKLKTRGFKLLLEILAKSHGASVGEEPVEFVDRRRGRSKFGGSEVFAYLGLCLELRRS